MKKGPSQITFLKAHWYYALASAAGGLLLAVSFPPAGLGLTAWVAFIPFFWAIDEAQRPGLAAFFGAVFGATFFFADVSWVYTTLRIHGHFPPVPAAALLVSMVLILALFPALSALLAFLLSRKGLRTGLTLPFIWVALEYLRTVGVPDFPWNLAGYSQVDRLRLIQIVDVTGIYGVSFLILLVNGTLWELFRREGTGQTPPWKLLTVVAAALVAAVAYGHVRLKDFPETPQKEGGFAIGVLQADIPQEIKWSDAARDRTFATYEGLGKQAVQLGARLLIWPETSVPVVFGSGDADWKRACDISSKLEVPMLIGAPSMRVVQGETLYHNSAFLVDGPSLRFRYDKIHLVPFGEYMPWTWLLPLGPGIAAREADFSPGETMTVMSVDGCLPFSVLICYEAIFPELSRLALKNGAKMLINITNDGWFGETAAPYQHLSMARVRSIENRVWLVRCANTGISSAIDPAGRTIKSIPLNERGSFVVRVNGSGTAGYFYSRYGDFFAWGCVVVVLVLIAAAARTRRRVG